MGIGIAEILAGVQTLVWLVQDKSLTGVQTLVWLVQDKSWTPVNNNSIADKTPAVLRQEFLRCHLIQRQIPDVGCQINFLPQNTETKRLSRMFKCRILPSKEKCKVK